MFSLLLSGQHERENILLDQKPNGANGGGGEMILELEARIKGVSIHVKVPLKYELVFQFHTIYFMSFWPVASEDGKFRSLQLNLSSTTN